MFPEDQAAPAEFIEASTKPTKLFLDVLPVPGVLMIVSGFFLPIASPCQRDHQENHCGQLERLASR
jgi:hypothetical protein